MTVTPIRPLGRLLAVGAGALAAATALAPAGAAPARAGHPVSGQARATARGTVSGVATDAKGHPLKGICVHGLGHRPFPATNARGAYTVKVRPGRYLVFFGPGCGNTGNWLWQWHTNGKFPYKPAPITVRAGHTTTASARLALGGAVRGRVTSRAGKLLAGVCVQLLRAPARYVASANFGNTGVITRRAPFRLTSVPPGRYRVIFSTTTCGNKGNYADQWWHDALSMRAATIITVRPGRAVTGIDQALPKGAVITGRVTGQGGVPLAGVCVDLSGSSVPGVLHTVTTTSDGRYRAQSLTTGKYGVFFDPSCRRGPASKYGAAWYPSKVKVTDGKVTSGIDITLTKVS